MSDDCYLGPTRFDNYAEALSRERKVMNLAMMKWRGCACLLDAPIVLIVIMALY